MKWRFVVPIVALAMFACAPKSGTPTQTRTARTGTVSRPNDPCRWLSERDAGEAIGQRVTRAEPPSPQYCRYSAPAKNADMILSIVFTVDDDVASYAKMIQRDDAATIAGLGDRAVWNTNGNSVTVVKGDRRLIMSIFDGKSPSTLSEADLQQKAVAAAQKIVDKM